MYRWFENAVNHSTRARLNDQKERLERQRAMETKENLQTGLQREGEKFKQERYGVPKKNTEQGKDENWKSRKKNVNYTLDVSSPSGVPSTDRELS